MRPDAARHALWRTTLLDAEADAASPPCDAAVPAAPACDAPAADMPAPAVAPPAVPTPDVPAPWRDAILAHAHHVARRDAERDARLARAHAAFAAAGDVAGLATCRSLVAAIHARAGRWDDALALLDENEALDPATRDPWERYLTLGRRRYVHWCRERFDAALRDSLLLLDAARALDEPACEVTALELLGGLEADLDTLDDALLHARAAVALADRHALGEWAGNARRNLAYALDACGRHAEALATLAPQVDALLAAPPGTRQHAPGDAENRWLLYATVLLHAGRTADAQRLLDESVALRPDGGGDRLGWTAAQAEAHLAQARPAEARAVCEAYLHDMARTPDIASGTLQRAPRDLLRVHRAAARACAALGDAAGTLAQHEAALACHEALVGRAARARRVALEVAHDLDRARTARAEAERRRRDAEAEQRRLDALNRALQAAVQARTRFLASASHDLRQPVQALMMYSAALRLEPASDAQQALQRRIEAALGALARMFDGLLDVSRLDAGLVAPAVQAVPLAPLLQRLADDARAVSALRGLAVRVRLPARPPLARTDPLLLERCLRNLVDNACRHTLRGGVLLAVRRVHGADPAAWRVMVLDTGCGIAPEDQPRVFDEFFQARAGSVAAAATSPDDGTDRRGLGLGLAIVQRLSSLLGHPVGLRSRAGRGTGVWLQVPALAGPDARTVHGPPLPDGQVGSPGLGGPDPATMQPATTAGPVAVLDDDPAVRDAVATLLARWGLSVIPASGAADAVRRWEAAGRPALAAVVADWRLGADGVPDGGAAVAALCEVAGRTLPALLLTAETASDALARIAATGLPWLPKPVAPLRLRAWLQAVYAAEAAAGGTAQGTHISTAP